MGDGELLAWCVVANVAAETAHGPAGRELRHGTRHFSPGTKVWVLPPQWDGDNLVVIGRHRGRGQGRLARMVVSRQHLTDFRAQGVYQPAVHRELLRSWESSRFRPGPLRQWESQEQAQEAAGGWNLGRAQTGGVRRPERRGELIFTLNWLVTGYGWGGPLTHTVHRLVNDIFAGPDQPAAEIGAVLRDPAEAALLAEVLNPMRAIAAEVGHPQPDQLYRGHHRWPEVIAAAAAAHAALITPMADA